MASTGSRPAGGATVTITAAASTPVTIYVGGEERAILEVGQPTDVDAETLEALRNATSIQFDEV
jgi:hypothetical protein